MALAPRHLDDEEKAVPTSDPSSELRLHRDLHPGGPPDREEGR